MMYWHATMDSARDSIFAYPFVVVVVRGFFALKEQ